MRLRLSKIGIVTGLALLAAGPALAQQAQQAPPAQPDMYAVITYIKVTPGNEDAYRTFLTTMSKRLYTELMTANSSLVAWSAARVMYGGVDGQSPDYIAATVFAGPPPEPGADMSAVYQKAAGMTQAEYQAKLATLRTVMGSEIVRSVARAGAPGTFKEGDFRVVAASRIKPGMGDEYVNRLRTLTQPVMQELIAQGEQKSWSAWGKVFPSGNATPYDALVATTFKDLASALRGPGAVKTAAAFAKVHPAQNFATYVNNGRDYSELQKRTISQVVALVERPQ